MYMKLEFSTKLNIIREKRRLRAERDRTERENNKNISKQEEAMNKKEIPNKHIMEDKKILLPKIMLTSDHYFYDKRTGFHAAIESHSINPEHNGGPKTLYGDEEKSEYHKYNIAKHSETKSYMDKFIIESSLKHTNFEARVGSRDDFKLDLSQYTINKGEFKKVNKQNSSNVVSQLKELRDLLEEKIITKDEFEIAKKKLLN